MAERVETYSFRPQGSGRRSKYPWDEWLDGSTWKLVQGTDYEVSTKSFRASLYSQARNAGLLLKVDMVDNEKAIVFRVTKPGTKVEDTEEQKEEPQEATVEKETEEKAEVPVKPAESGKPTTAKTNRK